ncbi:MAG: glycosyltransferase family 2 protein [Patescibacteria group bacterium]
MPRVSIITINYNGLNDTIECLESLKKIDYPNYEVFVVDNASRNNEGDKLKKKFGDYIKLIQSDKNLGFAGGNNFAIREIIKESKSKYICLLNNDTVVDKSFLDHLVEKAESDSNIASVMPQSLQYYNINMIDSCGIYYYKSGISLILNLNKEKDTVFKEKLFSSEGVCSIYRIQALKEIAYKDEYFDEDFFMYAEDLDLGFRLIHKGYISEFEVKSIIYHKRGTTAGKESDFARYHHSRNILLTIYKNYPTYFLLKYFISILIMQFGLGILYLKRGKLKILFKSYIGCFKMIPLIHKKREFILKSSNVKNKELIMFFEESVFPIKWILKK